MKKQQTKPTERKNNLSDDLASDILDAMGIPKSKRGKGHRGKKKAFWKALGL